MGNSLKAKEVTFQLRVFASDYNPTNESIDLTGNIEKHNAVVESDVVTWKVILNAEVLRVNVFMSTKQEN